MRAFSCMVPMATLVLVCGPLVWGQPTAPPQRAAPAASREQLEARLRDARTAFDQGTALLHKAPDEALSAFRAARDGFQAVVDAGIENGQLYYNLGNAHMALGTIGPAIASYRHAQRMIPGDEQLRANLRFARSLRRDHIEAGGKSTLIRTVFFWHYTIPLRVRIAVGLAVYGLFWALMIARATAPRLRLAYPRVLCLIVWLTLGASVAIDWPTDSQRRTEGVLIASDVVVRKGNGEGYDPRFKQPLHEGVEFRVLESRGGWIHIELPDENRGWVRERDAILF